ncbi:MAG: NAD-dependent epimerase/dehydratase family protein [Nitrospinae bacterium]|nr:NAD-dependent epimerase/dehydratase family protein [Nitrospinota bacterium]
MKVLVTGASGFVGRRLVPRLLLEGHEAVCALRSAKGGKGLPEGVKTVITGELEASADLPGALAGVDTVIHLAGRAHVMHDKAQNPATEYYRVNVEASRVLGERAVEAGVKRIVFASSVKAMGERTLEIPYTETSVCAPEDDYGKTKLEAENVLKGICARGGVELVILRFPLVYGPGVKGNMAALVKAARKGIPLPLGAATNLRSLIFVDNLVDAIIACSKNPSAASGIFLVSDGEDISTSRLYRLIGEAMDKRLRIPAVPLGLMKTLGQAGDMAGALMGRKMPITSGAVEKLFGSLRVDSSKIRVALGWTPPYSVEEGMRAMVEGSR